MSLSALSLGADVELEDEADVVGGGFQRLESGVYDALIKCVYLNETRSGAWMANALTVIDGNEHTFSECIMSKKSGELLPTYIDKKTKKKKALPGYSKFLRILELMSGEEIKDLSKVAAEKRPLKVWSGGKEEVQEKIVFTASIDFKCKVAVRRILETRDGEDKQKNEIVKVFTPEGLTNLEKKAGQTEPTHMAEWSEKNAGKDVDKRDKSAKPAVGAPVPAPTAALSL